MSDKIVKTFEYVVHLLKTDLPTQAIAALLVLGLVIYAIYKIVKATKQSKFGRAPQKNELVFYHADFCGYCHQFMPIFDQTVPALKEMYPDLIVTKLQHETDQMEILQAKPTVEGYPTLRLNGKEFAGPRTPDGLMSFVRENYRSD